MMAEVVNVDEELLDVLLSDELVAVDEDELVLSVLLVAEFESDELDDELELTTVELSLPELVDCDAS
jgi:hypothetical protein